jgi:hypothetical protein
MRRLLPLAVAVGLLTGCGASEEPARESERPTAKKLRAELSQATDPAAATFPTVTGGKSLREVAREAGSAGPEVGLATSVFPTGRPRVAFGVIDAKTGFVYGPTAIYLARSENGPALGPFPAPADLLVTEPAFRSRTAASEDDPFAAVYSAQVEVDRPGTYKLLAVTKVGNRLVGSPSQIQVVAPEEDRIPAVGERAPKVTTDTVASARGNIQAIETRIPEDSMHREDFADVVGRKPVALLFATPQLCASRVCGPVVDIAEQLKARYGDRMTFIHQEVYEDNDPNKGIRRPLQEFNLRTEPWLFTVDRSGRIAARLEGSFGLDAFERAVQAALR